MLKRICLLVLLLAPTSLCFSSAQANPHRCDVRDSVYGICLRYGGSSPVPGDGHKNPDRDHRQPAKPVCRFQGNVIPCTNGLGTWVPHRQMWCKPADPQPPKTSPIWNGHEDGVIHRCHRPKGAGVPDSEAIIMMWLPAAATTAPPDPKQMAWELITSAGFNPISIGSTPTTLEQKPKALGAIGMPLWLWPRESSPHTTGPLTASTAKAGYTVTIVARLESITWDLGDGSPSITCKHWKRFNPNSMHPETPVVCGKQFGYERQGTYTLTATSNWAIQWQGIGQEGVIPLRVSTHETLKIGELQAVITNSKRN